MDARRKYSLVVVFCWCTYHAQAVVQAVAVVAHGVSAVDAAEPLGTGTRVVGDLVISTRASVLTRAVPLAVVIVWQTQYDYYDYLCKSMHIN